MYSLEKKPISAPHEPFTRGKLGQSIFKKDPEFDATGTNIRDDNHYNCLHDPHLKFFFSQPEKKKHLEKMGLITDDNQVLCSRSELKHYENYRSPDQIICGKYLLHQQTSKKKMTKMDSSNKKVVSDAPPERFTRGKLGKSIFKKNPAFDATATNMRLNNHYNCLHDPHLKSFLNQPERKRQLKKMGLITDDNKVLCSRPEFEQYENYRSAVRRSCEKYSLQEMISQHETTKTEKYKKKPVSAPPNLFTRGKMGKSIFKKNPEFDATGTNIQDINQYCCLQDPHLRSFFSHPEKKKHLEKMGLITMEDEVLCMRSEFSQYETYTSPDQMICQRYLLHHEMSENKAKMGGLKKRSLSAPAILFSRGKLGKSIFKKIAEFDATDTNMQFNNQYTCLHDPHLKPFLHQPERKKLLKKMGLITDDEQVLCSRPEFEQYKSYRLAVRRSRRKYSLQDMEWLMHKGKSKRTFKKGYKKVCHTMVDTSSSPAMKEIHISALEVLNKIITELSPPKLMLEWNDHHSIHSKTPPISDIELKEDREDSLDMVEEVIIPSLDTESFPSTSQPSFFTSDIVRSAVEELLAVISKQEVLTSPKEASSELDLSPGTSKTETHGPDGPQNDLYQTLQEIQTKAEKGETSDWTEATVSPENMEMVMDLITEIMTVSKPEDGADTLNEVEDTPAVDGREKKGNPLQNFFRKIWQIIKQLFHDGK
ncbi:uncharacterized protein LOC128518402 [Clarias gariepinus]|uniref:uncharacterized protein LOC128518402 n=1 Tax=Clarias gariepinus TaxID=13013 RepID=UPI00234C43E9|nr:uncharacterized protein LOC128518402 [Clarias gariepinus]